MCKYFLDTEFLEGTQKTFFGKSKPTIDLISIGIVAEEDGREYYAISKDFNLKEAWNRWQWNTNKNTCDIVKRVYWIRENVLKHIWNELCSFHIGYNISHKHFGTQVRDTRHLAFSYKNLKWLIEKYGKTNKQIAEEVVVFVNSESIKQTGNCHTASQLTQEGVDTIRKGYVEPQFYGYYCDYDWVVFCWLFGKMMNLPKGFPYYCIDLKQILDEQCIKLKETAKTIKELNGYPKQTNEHNALADARWNFELYKFLQTLKDA